MEPAHLDLWNTSLEKENMGYAFCNVCFSQHLYEAVVGNVKLKHYSATASSVATVMGLVTILKAERTEHRYT